MTWIRTIPMSEADEKLRQAIEGQKGLYPKEYGDPVHPDESGGSSIVGSHTLIPEALYHSFARVWGADVAGVATEPAATRNDCDHGLGDQPVRVLNRVARRVSA